MRTMRLLAAGAALVLALMLSGCGTGTGGGASSPSVAGFPADAVIGVSIPRVDAQNWAEANDMFTTHLQAAGFKPMVQQAGNSVATQQKQIEAMVRAGAKVIVIGPVDGSKLGDVVEKAMAQGVAIIGYDGMIQGTPAVDAVVRFGAVQTGFLQGQALLDGLKAWKGGGPYNIELFGGDPSDPDAQQYFAGAMQVLQPKIDDGTLTVVSGQTGFSAVATPGWSTDKAQTRMDALLAGNYADKKIDGVLAPSDGIARAIIASCLNAGQETPVTSGLDADDDTVQWVWQGKQWSTTYKPTDKLVAQTIDLIKALQAGSALPTATELDNNGVKDVAVYAQLPVTVTKDNARQVFANDAHRLALLTSH